MRSLLLALSFLIGNTFLTVSGASAENQTKKTKEELTDEIKAIRLIKKYEPGISNVLDKYIEQANKQIQNMNQDNLNEER